MHQRRRARECALRALYACEIGGGEDIGHQIDYAYLQLGGGDGSKAYAAKIADSVLKNIEFINSLIVKHTQNWKLERIAVVDRIIMRVAIAEFIESPEVPYKVVIDEAIEIAKIYSTHESAKFVNGILDPAYFSIVPASRNQEGSNQ